MNKVVLLAPTPPPVGGMATWAVRMLEASLGENWQMELVDEKLLGKREVFGSKVKRNLFTELKRCVQIWKGLGKALKDPQVKVIHSNIPANTLPILREYICACITKLHRRKFVIHFHCTPPNIVKGAVNRFFFKRICNAADGVILLNQQSVDFTAKLTKTPLYLIPNFADSSDLVQSHEIRDVVKRALYVGGVIETKGCLDVIALAERYPNIDFRLAGRPEDTVEEAAKKVPNVTLLGVLDRNTVRKELHQADVFLFLSYFPGEGFSIALTEAMAAGLPCLVTDWAANKDMIENKGGFVVPVKDVDAAAEALEKMLPRQIRETQSAFNLEKIQAAYSDEKILSKYVACYETSIG